MIDSKYPRFSVFPTLQFEMRALLDYRTGFLLPIQVRHLTSSGSRLSLVRNLWQESCLRFPPPPVSSYRPRGLLLAKSNFYHFGRRSSLPSSLSQFKLRLTMNGEVRLCELDRKNPDFSVILPTIKKKYSSLPLQFSFPSLFFWAYSCFILAALSLNNLLSD